jgi:carboxylesterase type B
MAGAMLTQPVVDGEVLPSAPLERIRSGSAGGVDVLVGTNADDWRLFLAFTGAIGQITDEMLRGRVSAFGPQSIAAYGLPVEGALAAYRAALPGATPGEILAAIQTDWWCRIPAIRLAEAHAPGEAGTWMYEFAWSSPIAGGLFGACHALEIPFVFDTLDLGPNQMVGDLLGENPPQALATSMHRAWVSFIERGQPGWPQYDVPRRATKVFDTETRVVDDPRAWERAFWDGVR